jgi:hypothetical protein
LEISIPDNPGWNQEDPLFSVMATGLGGLLQAEGFLRLMDSQTSDTAYPSAYAENGQAPPLRLIPAGKDGIQR